MLNVKSNYICEIIRQKSFSKAAEKLYISQSSLSRYIIKLENQLGFNIFDRTVSPIELTEGGNILIEYINKTKELETEFLEDIKRFKTNSKLEIKIGIVPWRIPIFLPKIIPEFSKIYPNINVTITEDVSNRLESLLLDDKIDACVINGPTYTSGIECINLSSEKVILAVPNDINVIAKESINGDFKTIKDLKQIENCRFILLTENFRMGAIANEIFKRNNVNPRNITYVTNMNSALSMCSVGLGITFIPNSAIKNLDVDVANTPTFYQLEEQDYNFPLVIAFTKKSYKNTCVEKLIDFVKLNYISINDDM